MMQNESLIRRLSWRLVGSYLALETARKTDERGISQSTENAVLLTGAIAIAVIVIAAVKAYVQGKLGNLG